MWSHVGEWRNCVLVNYRKVQDMNCVLVEFLQVTIKEILENCISFLEKRVADKGEGIMEGKGE